MRQLPADAPGAEAAAMKGSSFTPAGAGVGAVAARNGVGRGVVFSATIIGGVMDGVGEAFASAPFGVGEALPVFGVGDATAISGIRGVGAGVAGAGVGEVSTRTSSGADGVAAAEADVVFTAVSFSGSPFFLR